MLHIPGYKFHWNNVKKHVYSWISTQRTQMYGVKDINYTPLLSTLCQLTVRTWDWHMHTAQLFTHKKEIGDIMEPYNVREMTLGRHLVYLLDHYKNQFLQHRQVMAIHEMIAFEGGIATWQYYPWQTVVYLIIGVILSNDVLTLSINGGAYHTSEI